jgi:hypothetical protein
MPAMMLFQAHCIFLRQQTNAILLVVFAGAVSHALGPTPQPVTGRICVNSVGSVRNG